MYFSMQIHFILFQQQLILLNQRLISKCLGYDHWRDLQSEAIRTVMAVLQSIRRLLVESACLILSNPGLPHGMLSHTRFSTKNQTPRNSFPEPS